MLLAITSFTFSKSVYKRYKFTNHYYYDTVKIKHIQKIQKYPVFLDKRNNKLFIYKYSTNKGRYCNKYIGIRIVS